MGLTLSGTALTKSVPLDVSPWFRGERTGGLTPLRSPVLFVVHWNRAMTLCPTDVALTDINAHPSAFKMPAADLADLREQSPSAPAIDMATLRQRCLGNEAFTLLLLDEFQSSVPKQLVGLARLVADANAPAIREAAHSLRGIASTLAAEGLGQTAANLEAASITGDWALILKCVMRVHRAALRCLADINHHRSPANGSEFADALLQRA